MEIPTGTVTFLFTDIEGSTRLWERYPDAMRIALARHDELLRTAIERHQGYVFKTVGDAFCAVFSTTPEAVQAALEAQLALQEEDWGEVGPLHVRMGLHTGEAEERNQDYFGPTVNRVARLQAVGYGQQTLLSQAAAERTVPGLPDQASLEDLGLHRLKDLSAPEHIWNLRHPVLPPEFAPLKTLDYLPTNLPAQVTSFIGRDTEMAEIKRLLGPARLLTLAGSGGTGKTRLSLQVGADLVEEYANGVWLAELAALTDPALVVQTVAAALNVREEPGRPVQETLVEALRDQSLLLVLDNCEHVLATAASLCDVLIKRCPRLKILASSREGLGVPGEQTYRIPSLGLLPVPLDQLASLSFDVLRSSEAVRLFADRASLVKSDFRLTEANIAAVARLCARLDGIPLALELAAARVRAMPVEQIETRLHDRFRLLTGGARTLLPRQQTLRALIDWSYDLLSDPEKHLFCRLSVFSGGWTLEAAESVCIGDDIEDWEVLDLLTALVDKSLVVYDDLSGTARYRLLETVRQYAGDRLLESGDGDTYRARHRDCYLALAEEAAAQMRGSEQADWLTRLEREAANMRQALVFCQETPDGAEPGLRLSDFLQPFWQKRGHLSEGRDVLTALLAHPGAQEPTLLRASALNGAGAFAAIQGDLPAAQILMDQSLAVRRAVGDTRGVAQTLNNLGNLAQMQGDIDTAEACLTEASALNRSLGNQAQEATNLANLGRLAQMREDYPRARTFFEDALAIHRAQGNQQGIAIALNNLGSLNRQLENYADAEVCLRECMELYRTLGDRQNAAWALEGFAELAVAWNQTERAVRLFGAAHALRVLIGAPLPSSQAEQLANNLAHLETILGADTYAPIFAAGQSLDFDRAIAAALDVPE